MTSVVVLLAPRDGRAPGAGRVLALAVRRGLRAHDRRAAGRLSVRPVALAPGNRRQRLVGRLARLLRLRGVEPGLGQAGALLGGERLEGGLRDGRGALADGGGVELLGRDGRLDDDARRPVERLLRARGRRPVDAVEQRGRDLQRRDPPSAGREGSRPETRARSRARPRGRPCTRARRPARASSRRARRSRRPRSSRRRWPRRSGPRAPAPRPRAGARTKRARRAGRRRPATRRARTPRRPRSPRRPTGAGGPTDVAPLAPGARVERRGGLDAVDFPRGGGVVLRVGAIACERQARIVEDDRHARHPLHDGDGARVARVRPAAPPAPTWAPRGDATRARCRPDTRRTRATPARQPRTQRLQRCRRHASDNASSSRASTPRRCPSFQRSRCPSTTRASALRDVSVPCIVRSCSRAWASAAPARRTTPASASCSAAARAAHAWARARSRARRSPAGERLELGRTDGRRGPRGRLSSRLGAPETRGPRPRACAPPPRPPGWPLRPSSCAARRAAREGTSASRGQRTCTRPGLQSLGPGRPRPSRRDAPRHGPRTLQDGRDVARACV